MATGGYSLRERPCKAKQARAAIVLTAMLASGCASNGGPSVAEECLKTIIVPPLYPLCLVVLPAVAVTMGVTAAGAEAVAKVAKDMNERYPGTRVGLSKDYFGPMPPGEMYVKPLPDIGGTVVASLSVNVEEEQRRADPQFGSYTTIMVVNCAEEKVSFSGWQRFGEPDLKGLNLGYEPFDPRLTFSVKERHFSDPHRKALAIACKATRR